MFLSHLLFSIFSALNWCNNRGIKWMEIFGDVSDTTVRYVNYYGTESVHTYYDLNLNHNS